MNNLQKFLLENPIDGITQQVRLGGRLKDFEFVIKPLSGAEANRYRQLCVKTLGSGKREFDGQKFRELLIINNTVTPNFKDAEWIKEANVADSTTLLYKTLLAGEIDMLAEKISEISGFGEDMVDLVDESKNS